LDVIMKSSVCPQLGQVFSGFTKPRRAVHSVFLHCSATSNPRITARDIDRWHQEKGWAGIGYTYFIRSDGRIEIGRDLEVVPAAQEGHNVGSIAICCNGLVKSDFSETQLAALVELCHAIDGAYPAGLRFRGHCEVAKKSCPVFDYRRLLGLGGDGHLPERGPATQALTVGGGLPALDAAVATVPVQRPTVMQGSAGGAVARLQVLLNAYGPVPPGATDGYFGPETLTAVVAYQRQHHLAADGIAGPATWEALEAEGPGH
jgi:hypothetical protein